MTLETKDLGLTSGADETPPTSQQFDFSGTLSEVAHRALGLVEKSKIKCVLEANGGNKSKTAEDLGISYKTLLTKLKEYDL
jgi:DNA-binding NtrC family response regulator